MAKTRWTIGRLRAVIYAIDEYKRLRPHAENHELEVELGKGCKRLVEEIVERERPQEAEGKVAE